MVLEEYEHAKRRGAKIYADVVGFSMSSDAYHIHDRAGVAPSMINALRDARITPAQVAYINAHDTSTPTGDKAETQALTAVFTECADKVMANSTKSITGHLLGAAGAIEAIFSVLALCDQAILLTINLDNPDKGYDLDYLPKKRAR